jgi:[histone H3]-lysine4 N-trimethyltransferase ATXR3
LFGCVCLPSFESCFGPSEQAYGDTQRKQLIDLLRDDKLQVMPWPANLKNTFNLNAMKNIDDVLLYGSPMLDTALGQVDATQKVLKHLTATMMGLEAGKLNKFSVTEFKKSKAGKGKKGKRIEDSMQLDNILPPEMPTNWIQCESCKKWRRVPWHVNVESLNDDWTCLQNTWDPESATCQAPQDTYDPATENTLEYHGEVKAETAVSVDDFVIGTWRDVYCIKNHVYYEAQVKKIKKPTNKKNKASVLFHYRGWSTSFDEWIQYDSDRIVAHHLFTNPEFTDPRAQEIWQGKEPVQAVVRSAYVNKGSGKKRKSSGGSNDDTSPSKTSKVVE